MVQNETMDSVGLRPVSQRGVVDQGLGTVILRTQLNKQPGESSLIPKSITGILKSVLILSSLKLSTLISNLFISETYIEDYSRSIELINRYREKLQVMPQRTYIQNNYRFNN